MFSAMVTYPENRSGRGKSSALGGLSRGSVSRPLFQSRSAVCRDLQDDFGLGAGSALQWEGAFLAVVSLPP